MDFASRKRPRQENVQERRVTLPSKKVIQLVNRANRNVGAQFAQPPPQFVFNAPQAPAATRMDIEQGERAAVMHQMGYPSYNPPSSAISAYSPRAYNRLKRDASASKKMATSYRASLAKKASKASLARARLSAKKGGTAIPKATLRKAADKGSYIVHFRAIMKMTKSRMIKALNLEPKAVLAACLAKRYSK